MSIKTRIETLLKEELMLDQEIKNESVLSDHGADSLDVFNILIGLEEEFEDELNKKPFPDDLLRSTDTFGEVVLKVENHLKG